MNCNQKQFRLILIQLIIVFEPVFWEHIYDIIQHEKPEGVIVQLGGQTAL
jgi:carbamoylphosphate synthase large subunit